MNASLLAVLTDAERLLVEEAAPGALAAMDEDEVAALHDRVRRARHKYVGLYRREASARVTTAGGRGRARPRNARNAAKAEVFEEVLARVSRRLATLAGHASAELRKERIAAARTTGGRPPGTAATSAGRTGPGSATGRKGDRAARSPRTVKRRASEAAAGQRRQAARDGR